MTVDVPGQPAAERILTADAGRSSPPQQLLLHGPRGSGKRRAARAMAWALVDPDREHDPDEEAGFTDILNKVRDYARKKKLDYHATKKDDMDCNQVGANANQCIDNQFASYDEWGYEIDAVGKGKSKGKKYIK